MYVHFPPDLRKVKDLLAFCSFAIVSDSNVSFIFSINVKFGIILKNNNSLGILQGHLYPY